MGFKTGSRIPPGTTLSWTSDHRRTRSTPGLMNRLTREFLSLVPAFEHRKRSRRSLIRRSRVYRHWKSTFTDTPALWTHFCCKGPPGPVRSSNTRNRPHPRSAILWTLIHLPAPRSLRGCPRSTAPSRWDLHRRGRLLNGILPMRLVAELGTRIALRADAHTF
jgi:hypothetical protein